MNHLKYKIKAGSILELIIAMSIIATAIALFTVIYSNLNQSAKTLNEIDDQGHSFSKYLYTSFLKGDEFGNWQGEFSDIELEEINFNGEKGWSIKCLSFRGKLLWETERIKLDRENFAIDWDDE